MEFSTRFEVVGLEGWDWLCVSVGLLLRLRFWRVRWAVAGLIWTVLSMAVRGVFLRFLAFG